MGLEALNVMVVLLCGLLVVLTSQKDTPAHGRRFDAPFTFDVAPPRAECAIFSLSAPPGNWPQSCVPQVYP